MILNYSGTFNEFDFDMRSRNYRHVLLSHPVTKETKPIGNWLTSKKDLTVRGKGFTRSLHLLGCGRTKNGKFRWDFIYD